MTQDTLRIKQLEQALEERTRDLESTQEQLRQQLRGRDQRETEILRAAEEWECTFDAVPDLVMILDINHRIVRVNRATVAKVASTKESLVGSCCYKIFHGTEEPPSFCPCHSIGTDIREYDVEVFEPRLGGTFRVTVTAIRDAQGELLGFVHVARDISEHKRIQMELAEKVCQWKRANEESQALLKCSRALLECDDFKTAAQRIFEVSKEVIGATSGYLALLNENATESEVHYLDPGDQACSVDPSLPMPVRGLRGEALAMGDIACHNDFAKSRWTSLLPAGHITVSNVMFAPLLFAGKAVGLLGLANKPGGFDENDRRLSRAFAEFAVIGLLKTRAEEALRESEAKFRQIAENIEEAFWLTLPADLERKSYVSPAFERLWACGAETLLHDPAAWLQPIHEEDREKVLLTYDRFVSGLASYDVEYRIVRQNGSMRWIWDRAFPIYDERGEIHRVVGVAQDITQRKLFEQKQQQLMDEVRHFAYIISHDLRAPLINLNGFCCELETATEGIREAVEDSSSNLPEGGRNRVMLSLDDAFESVQFIKSSVSRMGRLIEAILRLSRFGHQELCLQPLDMNELVNETLNSLAHQINQQGIEISVGYLPELVADRTAMEQIVANLLDNSIKYLAPSRQGWIRINGRSNGDEHTIVIADNGIGIDLEDRDSIFQVFQRAGKLDVPGEGMGLAYVRALVRRHGGRIWCHSTPGEGSSFAFTIANNLHVMKFSDQRAVPRSFVTSEGS